MWTSGDVGFEVAMNDGNKAICCSEWVDSVGVGRDLEGVISDEIDGEGEGGSWTLVVERALPFDLLISSIDVCCGGRTSWYRASASSSSQCHRF